jgi:hypothetical protein
MVSSSEKLDLSRTHLKVSLRLEKLTKGNCHVQSDRYQMENNNEAGQGFSKHQKIC